MKRFKVMLACVAVAGLTVLNFTQSRASFMRNTMASSSSESSETDTSGSSTVTSSSTSGGGTKNYSWSHAIECPAKARGKTYYHVCQENGFESSCASGGTVTCECGRNCGGV